MTPGVCNEYQEDLMTFTRSDILRKLEARSQEHAKLPSLVGSDVTASSQDGDGDGGHLEQ